MTVLEQDLETIKTMIMQKRGAYHISDNDKSRLAESLMRVKEEVLEIL